MADHLSLLRKALAAQKLDGFILPVNDEFMGEYVPDSAKRLTWLTGFTGSAGMVVVLKDKAAFFTDGRYTLQAKAEVKGYELHNSGDLPPAQWIAEQAAKGAVIGYDPKLHTSQAIRRYEQEAGDVKWQPVMLNPIDALWADRPAAPASRAVIQPLEYAGESSADKRARIAKAMKATGADAAMLTAPDSICWLLNLRGADVPFTPFLLCYAILEASGKVTVYLDSNRISPEVKTHLGSDVIPKSPSALAADFATLKGKRVMYDASSSPVWFHQQLTTAGAHVVVAADPCHLLKARKNAAELEGMRQAHIRDGLAVTRFLHWFSTSDKQSLDELTVAAKLEAFRKASNMYLEPSFTTISGSGPNGAIVHYRVTEDTNRKVDNDSLFLLDSGGQYPDGTTDITRTLGVGKPSAEMKTNFTRVLKGHIALASATFPEGTSGTQLDSLARQYLWQAGLDYDHGTGHGVGSHLSVHEGPQRISKRGGDTPLEVGMIISNEPGYYKNGGYGIRIENLVAVKEVSSTNGKRFFGFETITLAPLDVSLIDKSMLTEAEITWLNVYHQKIYDIHAAKLSASEAAWLKASATL